MSKPRIIDLEPAGGSAIQAYRADTQVTRPGIRDAIESRLEDWIRYLSIEEGSLAITYNTYVKGLTRFT